MRTREEQISELAGICEDAGILAPGAAHGHAEDILNEAEQRVRAEIGRDSERLDWLGNNLTEMRINRRRRYITISGPLSSHDLRKAIDAAREVG